MSPIRRLLLSNLGLVFAIGSMPAGSYEFVTHAAITRSAFNRFVTEEPGIIDRLGLWDLDDVFGGSYYYLYGNTAVLRGVDRFEAIRISGDGISASPLSIAGWLMRGAIREDDDPSPKDPSPKGDDPQGDIHRVFRHFFDPTSSTGGALSVYGDNDPCVLLFDMPVPCQSALNWGIGTSDARIDVNQPSITRRNHFSVVDARETVWRALTLMKSNGDGSFSAFTDQDDPVYRRVQRQEYWATTFRALGDVLHLNQDMAQPQHTRNDAHSGESFTVVQSALTGHKSTYEQFVEASAIRAESMVVGSDTPNPIKITFLPLTFDGYPTPKFDRYTDFWTTDDQKGLADFSNAGFFTAGKNIRDVWNPYTSPTRDPSIYAKASRVPVNWNGTPISTKFLGTTTQLIGSVHDYYSGQVISNVPMTGYGLWDQFMQERGLLPHFTLYRENYVAQANLLLPRAVAYSAGILEYFFRGQIDISAPDEGVYGLIDHAVEKDKDTGGFDTIKLKLKNSTPNQTMSGGTVVAVLRFHRNSCYRDDLSGEPGVPGVDEEVCREIGDDIVVSEPQKGASIDTTPRQFKFTFAKKLPINATDVRLQVVYRGTLGSETDAIAIGAKDISEPTFMSYINASDYIRIDGHVYTRDRVDSDQALLSRVYPQSCVDYTQSPPRLQPYCLQPFPMDLTLGFNASSSKVEIEGLPVRRFMRFAFLSDLVDEIPVNQFRTPCSPDPFLVVPLEYQVDFDKPSETMTHTYPTFEKTRGIYGWFGTSCVRIGDGVDLAAQDDRDAAMADLTEKYPLPTTVTFK
jgi:hypothetical protein